MSPRTRHFIRHQLPAIVWALVIFTASSIPASRIPHFMFKISDKLIHASIFLVFGLFVYRALEKDLVKRYQHVEEILDDLRQAGNELKH